MKLLTLGLLVCVLLVPVQGWAFPTNGVIDSGTGSDENPLAGNWTSKIHSVNDDAIKRLSNQFASITSGYATAFYSATSYGADQEGYITCDTPAAGSVVIEIHLRITNGNTTTPTHYRFSIQGSTLRIYKVVAGAVTQINSDETVSISAGESFGASVNGTTLQAYKKTGGVWSTAGSPVTDSAVSGAGNIGIGFRDDASLLARMTNFGGGTLSSVTRSLMMMGVGQ